jgi:hypothetical protein
MSAASFNTVRQLRRVETTLSFESNQALVSFRARDARGQTQIDVGGREP